MCRYVGPIFLLGSMSWGQCPHSSAQNLFRFLDLSLEVTFLTTKWLLIGHIKGGPAIFSLIYEWAYVLLYFLFFYILYYNKPFEYNPPMLFLFAVDLQPRPPQLRHLYCLWATSASEPQPVRHYRCHKLLTAGLAL